jgi:hypothetical protein
MGLGGLTPRDTARREAPTQVNAGGHVDGVGAPRHFHASGMDIELATKRRLPSMCTFRELADTGCLMAYGPSVPASFRRAAYYVYGLRHVDGVSRKLAVIHGGEREAGAPTQGAEK